MSRSRDDKPERQGGDFLGRWSRRKRAAAAAPAPAEAAKPEAAAEAAAEPAKSDAELLEELGLPDPDTLAPGDDFSAFMARAVPRHLRNRALRRLWTSNPVLANLDGLNDYDEDFTDAATVVAGMKSAYQVGRGFVERVAGNREAEGQPETGEGADAGAGAEAPGETFAQAEPEAGGEGKAGEHHPETPDDGPPAGRGARAQPARRRMRFRLTED